MRLLQKKLDRSFFNRDAITVATELLGTIMVRRVGRVVRRARIVETEAYLGPKDLASHASKGRTQRNEVMFGPPGRAYVYFIYGMHWMFNITTGPADGAHALLIRAAEPLEGWEVDLCGPGRLAKAFGITRADNGMDLAGEDIHFIVDDPAYRARILKTKRVGIDYARHWKDRRLRFIDRNNSVAKRLRF